MLSLFDSTDLPEVLLEDVTAPEPLFRAYCSWCGDFTVERETDRCAICQRPRSEKYGYVEIEDDDE